MPGRKRPPLDRAMRSLAAVRRELGHERPISLDEAIHVSERISRRNFLRLGGIAGAGLLLGGCDLGSGEPDRVEPDVRSPDPDGPRIVIVGAGLAGLTAAFRLHQAGVGSLVFEARDRVGGRCWSARGFEGGQIGEHGGEFVDTRHVHLQVLAEELGLTLDDLWEAWIPGSTWLHYVDGGLVKPRSLFEDMDAAIARIVRLAEQGPYFAGQASPRMRAFDERSEADWFREEVGPLDSPMYRLWAEGQTGWYGLDPDRLGAANLIDFYAIDYPGGDERYTIRGGNDQLPEMLADRLPAGTVTLEAPLEAIRRTSAGAIELRFTGRSDAVVADRVILTLPFTTLRDVDMADAGFSSERLRAIEELAMGTNAKLLLQFDRPFYTGFGDWSGGMQYGDDPSFGTWESSGTDGGADLGLLTVYTGGRVGAGYPVAQAHGEPPGVVVDSTLAAIDRAVPGVSQAFSGTSWLDVWALDPWVHGSYAAFGPGQITSLWGTLGAPEGSVHFAGEHTSVFSQGFLNGGVESGDRAAAEVLDALGLPPPEGLERSLRRAERFEPKYPWA